MQHQTGGFLTCGHCGTPNAPSEQFCVNCGYTLAGPPTGIYAAVVSSAPSTGNGRRITGSLSPGTLLSGRYRIVDLVGKGGFGAVYKALDLRFSARRQVAIKEMGDALLSPSEKARALADFRQEADLLVQLQHPNLPNVSDFFEEAGKAYLVMEFIEGKTLAKVLEERGGPLDEATVMGWGLELCAVLHYLHTRSQAIIFRDMKPANIMLTPEGQLKLIDFGIARIFKSQVTRDTTLLGSQGYAPLEQYGRGQSDARSDIYALGATLYELLTGELPLDAPTRRINPDLFQSPRALNPRLSAASETIILTAMAEDPAQRYQTAAAMYMALLAAGFTTASGTGSSLPGLPAAPIAHPAPPVTSLPVTPLPATPGQGLQPPLARPGGRRISRRLLLTAGAVGLVAGAGLLSIPFFFTHQSGGGTSGLTGQIALSFVYSTEKESWISAAIAAFNQRGVTLDGKRITLPQAEGRGSLDARNRILSGQLRPIAWSPASTLELNQLSDAWKAAHGGRDILASSAELLPRSLVFSPLVFAVWEERARLLLEHYQHLDWEAIHSAVLLKNGWQDLGGPASWGQVKLAQTRPDQSNSGLLTIALLAYAYFHQQRGLTSDQVRDKGFLRYLDDVEGAVTQFGRSSGTYLEREVILKGPTSYDLAFTYENLVLTYQAEARQRQGMALLPFYPDLNLLSDHPFVIFDADWVTSEQQEAARLFRDFLLEDEQQREALKSGFRPTSARVTVQDRVAGNPFPNLETSLKIALQLGPEAQPPPGNVTDILLQEWLSAYGTSATATS
ncbi:MAG: substrate-binding domain-containing protein [Thermogemmatispora sp.]|uniref:protein kinase domain-containing protein n=1 Tax=Thermogemmatispora sp. TaxID=1968838 RepID=UPI00262602DE|nr:protein kinase [Thermogemmatispora sp.]MBX5458154.1 substrate-binding domain-containing protein [Thermogemmatispora sp.]